ncbi:MAG: DUF4175 family protein [Candidatus Neomarinimicrobiota bacterium]
MTERPIQRTLRRVRSHLARLTLGRDLLLSAMLLASVFTAGVWYERQLYLSTTTRTVIMWGLVDLILLLVLVIILRWLGTWRGWWPWVQMDSIAARVGNRLASSPDRLLNALQLERRLAAEESSANTDLVIESVRVVAQRLHELDFHDLVPRRYLPPVRLVGIVVILLVLTWAVAPRSMVQATARLVHPDLEYPVPTPFILLSLTGDMEILGRDTAEVVFTAIGAAPPAVDLVWDNYYGQVHTTSLPLVRDHYTYRLENMQDDLRYHARFTNRAWFSPWDQIVSRIHTITIIDRPVIEELTFKITPPEYTREPSEEMGGNVADITALIGSRIHLRGTTTLPLKSSTMNLGEEEIPISADGHTLRGSFTLERSTDMTISVVDKRGVTNANPIHYTFTALPDYPPTLSVILPIVSVDLDESMMVPIQFDVSDDFGFSRSQVTFELHHPEYLTPDDQIYTHIIPELLPANKSQRVTHVWELGELNLVPGDEVNFHITVDDNNIITGPGRAVSGTLIARVPTLTDLFARVAESSDEAASTAETVLEDLEEVRALLEEMELAFRNEEHVSWEQQQKGREVLETLEEVIAAMESVQKQIQELGTKAEENSLFSDELLEKYDELQNLLEEIMTPELEEAMAQLREALQNMDPERLKNALQNMQFQASEFEAQLDRFLDIFRLALAEMKMDEIVKRLERMVAIEEQLLRQLNNAAEGQGQDSIEDKRSRSGEAPEPSRSLQDLAARHEEQERALEAVKETMREAAEAVEPYSPQAASQLHNLRDANLTQETEGSLQRGTGALQNQQLTASQANLQESRDHLQALQNEAAAIGEQFQLATVGEMLARFQRIMSGVLAMSKQQEELFLTTEHMSHSSPRVREAAERQHLLVKGMSRLIEQLIALSHQSFYITPEVGRTVGRANAAMHKAVGSLEANDPRGAAKAQQEGMIALNETAMALNNAMAVMQQSGSASGYEQFLQRMQNLTQGQQGLNDQVLSMQLGQMAAMSRIELMRRLQARQRQLAQVLEQVLEDFPTQSGGRQGGLGQALEDMEEVIKDFQRRRVTRQTLERQQKIVTRLLDSQKSLTVQDFKEERKGEAPTQILTYAGPSGLPANLGEREDLIMQAMDKALRTGYSQDYQVIIQNYFQQLTSWQAQNE